MKRCPGDQLNCIRKLFLKNCIFGPDVIQYMKRTTDFSLNYYREKLNYHTLYGRTQGGAAKMIKGLEEVVRGQIKT